MTKKHSCPNIKKIIELKLYSNKIFILSTSGHCGVDWIHSCLDGHPDIVITPAVSLLRSMAKIKKRGDEYKTFSKCVDLMNHYYTDDSYSSPNRVTKRRAIFQDKGKYEKFMESFEFHYNNIGLLFPKKTSFQKLFYSFHYAYADMNGQTINENTVLIHQEHVPFHTFYYVKQLKPAFIFLVRDPRAMFIGSWVGMRKKDLLDAYHFCISLTYYTSFMAIIRSRRLEKSPVYIVQNEKFNANFNFYIKHLCDFIGVKLHSSLFEGTINNQTWLGESCYIEKEEAFTEEITTYYEIKNVQKRWKENALNGEISYIESLCRPHMLKYQYSFLRKELLFNQRIFVIYKKFFEISFVKSKRILPKRLSDFLRLVISYHFPILSTRLWLIR